jgi:nucleotide-binding universal stress UspA family protein
MRGIARHWSLQSSLPPFVGDSSSLDGQNIDLSHVSKIRQTTQQKLDVHQALPFSALLSWVFCHFQQEHLMYKRILVATDGSTLSKKAVASAIDMAVTCGAELIAIKVVPRYPQAYFEGSIPLSSEEISRVEAQWTESAKAQLAAVEKTAKAKAVITKAITVKSDVVSDAIIAAAKKHKADLIVMASHGRKGIKRLLLGSETQQVLTHSHIPVLVLR